MPHGGPRHSPDHAACGPDTEVRSTVKGGGLA